MDSKMECSLRESSPMDSVLPLIRINVRNAFDASYNVLSVELSPDECIIDVKQLLETAAEVPAIHQTLLEDGQMVPLQDHQTLAAVGLQSNSVLLLIQKRSRDPLRELRELCSGCTCPMIFTYGRYRRRKFCDCEPSWVPTSDWQLHYLMRASPQADLELHLQDLYRSALLSGRIDATRVLADDIRVDVDGCDYRVEVPGCGCCVPPRPLIEEAAAQGQTDTCRVLIESGRLEANLATNFIMHFIVARSQDFPGRSLYFPLRDMIVEEGWSDSTFGRQYLAAISGLFGHKATVGHVVHDAATLDEHCYETTVDHDFAQTRNAKERSSRHRQERRLVAELRGDEPLSTRGPKRRQRLGLRDQELNRRRVERTLKTGDY